MQFLKFSYWIVKKYREAYNLFACNGILFNHESPLRGETFVTKKIVKGIYEITLGKENDIFRKFKFKKRLGTYKDYVLGIIVNATT